MMLTSEQLRQYADSLEGTGEEWNHQVRPVLFTVTSVRAGYLHAEEKRIDTGHFYVSNMHDPTPDDVLL